MSTSEDNICIINADSGIGTSSPQISQFSHNCSAVKFIVDKDLSDCSVVIITNSDGVVSAVAEGDALTKSYDDETKETTLVWYPQSEITFQSGCVVYQIAAYRGENEYIWYSKEGRLIVNDSIDTTDMSTALIGSSPNLVIQILNLSKGLERDILNLSDIKVDKIDGKGLSTEDYTTSEKEKLDSLFNYDDTQIRSDISSLDSRKVDKISGKGLSTEDYTTAEKEKLSGLFNYDDTKVRSDISSLDSRKVDKISGKGLSTEDYTTAEKEKLSGLFNYDDTKVKSDISSLESRKVDKISGKGLSTEDYTTAEKEKLSGLANYDDTQIKSDIQTQQDEIDNLDNRISSVEVSIGDIDTALDSIIAIQNKLIGGGTA